MVEKIPVLIVCRMGSSRLPGKILKSFGQCNLLEHLIKRLMSGGISKSCITVCTSRAKEDEELISEAERIGVSWYAGDENNVTARLLDATQEISCEEFLLVLGDNPWIDPAQIGLMIKEFRSRNVSYLVSVTPELARAESFKNFPVGTRLQIINRSFLDRQYRLLRNAETEEHVSLLFRSLFDAHTIFEPTNGWGYAEVKHLNMSINTPDDLALARRALNALGADATVSDLVNQFYMQAG